MESASLILSVILGPFKFKYPLGGTLNSVVDIMLLEGKGILFIFSFLKSVILIFFLCFNLSLWFFSSLGKLLLSISFFMEYLSDLLGLPFVMGRSFTFSLKFSKLLGPKTSSTYFSTSSTSISNWFSSFMLSASNIFDPLFFSVFRECSPWSSLFIFLNLLHMN